MFINHGGNNQGLRWVCLILVTEHKSLTFMVASRCQMNRDHDQRYPSDLIMVSGLFNKKIFETHGCTLHVSCSPIHTFCCTNSFRIDYVLLIIENPSIYWDHFIGSILFLCMQNSKKDWHKNQDFCHKMNNYFDQLIMHT